MGYKQYCKNYQDIENFERAKKDNFKCWECHHRLETHTPDGKRRGADISRNELIALGLYYNRPPEELIFLTTMEHVSLHNKGKHRSVEAKKRISEAQTGENNSMYGKHHSEETRKKMSEAKQNISAETRRKMGEAKKGNTNTKGKHWYNNGKINIMSKECPEGFVPGMLR